MRKDEIIQLLADAIPEAVNKLESLDIAELQKLDRRDLEILEKFIVFIDDIS